MTAATPHRPTLSIKNEIRNRKVYLALTPKEKLEQRCSAEILTLPCSHTSETVDESVGMIA